MSNIVIRTITGAIFTGMIVASILFGIYSSTAVLGLFLGLGLFEYSTLFKNYKGIKINSIPFVVFGLLSFALGSLMSVWYTLTYQFYLVSIVGFLFIASSEIWRKKEQPFLNVSVAIFGWIYLLIPFLLVSNMVEVKMNGFPIIIGMFILIWTNDTFAYLSGRFFGKTKLIERISPKKTWEGTIGGFIMTILFAAVIGYFTNQMLFWIVAGMLIAPAANIGDLFESIIKRNLNIKDSGNILPGHGGILDRFDAMLFAGPIFFIWVMIYPMCQG